MNDFTRNNTPDHTRLAGISLILGGARSGKSRFGERLALGLDDNPVYLATAEIRDEEMRERIDLHKRDRSDNWTTLEEPLEIADKIAGQGTMVIDCLTLWLSNLMERERDVKKETERFVNALGQSQGNVIMISNETGLGIVPDNALARTFRDQAGRLNQRVAEVADNVIFMAAGLPMVLKKNGEPIWGDYM
ncbi:bifunctional adenosylcobinamide kinase/adenosylcobinamide-phosphate guanylyltransferase [Emcibacter sp.]|uniref:bifunctional adenosylcobinamide kinase/adenosylcobinamide-phosphate guanylyltransferase n=1 Tax=Emcibacter sp. TaxID=1979954 RepID=UPI003A902520